MPGPRGPGVLKRACSRPEGPTQKRHTTGESSSPCVDPSGLQDFVDPEPVARATGTGCVGPLGLNTEKLTGSLNLHPNRSRIRPRGKWRVMSVRHSHGRKVSARLVGADGFADTVAGYSRKKWPLSTNNCTDSLRSERLLVTLEETKRPLAAHRQQSLVRCASDTRFAGCRPETQWAFFVPVLLTRVVTTGPPVFSRPACY